MSFRPFVWEVNVDANARRRWLGTQLTPGPEEDCPRCRGDREVHGRPCPECQGDER